MLHTRSRRRPMAVVAALAAAAVGLAGCAQTAPGAPGPSTGPSVAATPEPTAAATQSATPTPTPTQEPEVVTFETQNGTMRISIPADWSVEDTSELRVNHDGREQWANVVAFLPPSGGVLHYYDGHEGDAGAVSEVGTVATRETVDGFVATAYWRAMSDGRFEAHTALMPGGQEPSPESYVGFDSVGRLHSLVFQQGQDRPIFRSQAEAEEYLASDDVARILDVMATVDLMPVDQYAMP